MSDLFSVALRPGEELNQTSDRRYPLGTEAVTIDRREFVYAKAGEALDVGIPCQAPALIGDLADDTSAKLVTSITTYGVTANYLRISTTWGTPGGSTGVTKNMFRDGYVWITSGTGAGQMMWIRSNTTGSSGTAAQYTDVQFRDDETLHEAIDTQVLVSLNRNPLDGIIEYDGLATLTGPIVGVPPRDITNAYFFWLQKKGPCPVLTDGTVVLGNVVIPTTSTGVQAVEAIATATGADLMRTLRYPRLGIVIRVSGDTKYSLVDLDI